MRIAIIQMQSTNRLIENMNKMKQRVEDAAKAGAELVVFPEVAYFTGKHAEWVPLLSRYEDILQEFRDWAKAYRIAIIPGTLREPLKSKEHSEGRCFNTMVLIQSQGQIVAKYRKIFLFRALLPGKEYDESKYCEAGSASLIHNDVRGNLGFAICFDLRFPEMFRHLKKHGAQIVILPSAFTVPTGKAHWKTLVTARAIENQFFMVAPGLVGKNGEFNENYGHSLVVSPWGEILCEMGDAEDMQVVDLKLNEIADAASRVNAWECRREEVFPIR